MIGFRISCFLLKWLLYVFMVLSLSPAPLLSYSISHLLFQTPLCKQFYLQCKIIFCTICKRQLNVVKKYSEYFFIYHSVFLVSVKGELSYRLRMMIFFWEWTLSGKLMSCWKRFVLWKTRTSNKLGLTQNQLHICWSSRRRCRPCVRWNLSWTWRPRWNGEDWVLSNNWTTMLFA